MMATATSMPQISTAKTSSIPEARLPRSRRTQTAVLGVQDGRAGATVMSIPGQAVQVSVDRALARRS